MVQAIALKAHFSANVHYNASHEKQKTIFADMQQMIPVEWIDENCETMSTLFVAVGKMRNQSVIKQLGFLVPAIPSRMGWRRRYLLGYTVKVWNTISRVLLYWQ